MSTVSHPYAGRIAGLATKHGKLPLVAGAMRSAMGLEVVEVPVDTDVLGTFTGEVPRAGTMWEAAVAKARLGMEQSGLPLGLASEGSFEPWSTLPSLIVDTEFVVLVDDVHGIVVGEMEMAVGVPSVSVLLHLHDLDDTPLLRAGFPEHGLIVRPSAGHEPIVKGIHDHSELRFAVAACAAASPHLTARVESDLRAHHHPRRREVIARAAERLAKRLARLCPECRTPGWGIGHHETGAPCADCGAPTGFPLTEHWLCAACNHSEQRPTTAAGGVDPTHCPDCNP